jgi:hypothetical protein
MREENWEHENEGTGKRSRGALKGQLQYIFETTLSPGVGICSRYVVPFQEVDQRGWFSERN